jgi:hypothetical protein
LNQIPPKLAPVEAPPSNLFYLTRLRRPLIDRAEGIYMYARDGRRFIDGSSGAMVVNIGHGNRNVLDAMKRQMDRATFAYRLHFENEPAEELARRLSARMPEGLDRYSSFPAARRPSNPRSSWRGNGRSSPARGRAGKSSAASRPIMAARWPVGHYRRSGADRDIRPANASDA